MNRISNEVAIIFSIVLGVLAWAFWYLVPYALIAIGIGALAVITFKVQHIVLRHDRMRAETEAIRHEMHMNGRHHELATVVAEQEHMRGMIDLQVDQYKLLMMQQKHAALESEPLAVDEYTGQEVAPITSLIDLLLSGRYQVGWHGRKLATGLDRSGEVVTVPINNAGHIALAGSTGNGKTNTLRYLLSQLVGAYRVYYISPAYADIKGNGDDWRNIRRHLAAEPARVGDAIRECFQTLIVELQSRMDREAVGDTGWFEERIYCAIDEYREVTERYTGASEDLGKLLRMGRQYRIFIILASQDFLIKNIGGDSGARDSYGTVFYFGGDSTTCRSLLGKTIKDEGLIGVDGLCQVKTRGMDQGGQLMRMPLADNDGLSVLLSGPVTQRPPLFSVETRSNMVPDEVVGQEESGAQGEYVFTPAQSDEFVSRYKELGKIKPVLRAMHLGNGYYQSAKYLIESRIQDE